MEEQETATASRELPLEFHATGGEYFRIWIVNLLLTIITIGIYSAWAKVRRLRYFYGSTQLDGSSFEYHGKPIPILKGRLIAVGAYLIFVFGTQLSPIVALVMLPVIIFGVPWIIMKSRLFQARMSAWRGLRFNFHGNYMGALAAYIGWSILAMLTLLILWPFALWRQARYILGNVAFGTERFDFHATAGQFYKFCLVGLAIMIGAGFVAAMVVGALFADQAELRNLPANAPPDAALNAMMAGGIVAAYAIAAPVLVLAVAWFTARMINVSIGGLTLGPHQLFARLKTWPLFWILLTNLIAMIFTLGLFYPWAKVRKLRYQLTNMGVVANGSLAFVADSQVQASAVGEGLSDVFDVDFGF